MAGPVFRKSTRSPDAGQCVEVATNMHPTALVRDSKDATGPVLAFTADDWQAFTAATRSGTFTR